MTHRHAMPTLWLMTDERADAALDAALRRLPPGAGVIFRHYRTPARDRRRRFEAVRRLCRARRLVLVLAGPPRLAIGWRADGAHGRSPHRRSARALIRTVPAHDATDLVAAARYGAIPFLSPVFATRSHPGGSVLGPLRFGWLVTRYHRDGAIALGGMDSRRYARLRPCGAIGWAAIDAWSRPHSPPAGQKRNAVPR